MNTCIDSRTCVFGFSLNFLLTLDTRTSPNKAPQLHLKAHVARSELIYKFYIYLHICMCVVSYIVVIVMHDSEL